MKTTRLGFEIIKAGEGLLAEQIIEAPGANKDKPGKLYGLLQEYTDQAPFNGKYVSKTIPPYCAITATICADRAMRVFGMRNQVRHAAANQLIKQAEIKGIRTEGKDSKSGASVHPVPGCMFVVKSSGASSGRHAGIVWQVLNDKEFLSIEGNNWAGTRKAVQINANSGCTFFSGGTPENNREGLHSFRRKISEIAGLIHTEEMLGEEIMEFRSPYESAGNLPLADGEVDELVEGAYCLLDVDELEATEGHNGPDSSNNIEEEVQALAKQLKEEVKRDYILGIPKNYLYIGGGVVGLLGMILIYRKLR